ncbi:hypothetical protein AgCh_002798 [Apium graveolens]
MAFSNWGEISSPIRSSGSSMNVPMPTCFKALRKWPVKPLRVSIPLKLKNTFHCSGGLEVEDMLDMSLHNVNPSYAELSDQIRYC